MSLLRFISVLIVFLSSNVAIAGFIKYEEGIDHLEWLEFEYTKNLTRNEVLALISSDSNLTGYRYATINEVALLLNSYSGIKSIRNPISSQFYPQMGRDSLQFFGEFGQLDFINDGTDDYLRSGFKFGGENECGEGLSCGGFVHAWVQSYRVQGYYDGDYGWDVTTPDYTTANDDDFLVWWRPDIPYASLIVRNTLNISEPPISLTLILSLIWCMFGKSISKRNEKLRVQ